MPVEILTYAALGARLAISAGAARSLARRHRLPRSRSDAGKALVTVDLADIRHRRRPPHRDEAGDVAAMAAKMAAFQAEIVRIETTAAGHRADFERERERADQLMIRLLQATAETMAARETTARLEGVLRGRGRTGRSTGGNAVAARSPGFVAADLVAADRKACR
jgi:hypothetical protein